MFKPTDITEDLLFCTTRIETKNGSCGTGFFLSFKFGDKQVPIVVTNKHVVENNPNCPFSMTFHLDTNSEGPINTIIFNASNFTWYFHPIFDLCFLPVIPIVENIYQNSGQKVFFEPIDETLICDDEKLKKLTALEHVIMVGYPMGLFDTKNNMPLLRNGYTASHPMLDFQVNGRGVVDMACINGSSGSPIFIFNDSTFRQKGSKGISLGGRLLFLGVLHAGPELPREGEIVTLNEYGTKNVSLTKIPINLGYYIKSKELLLFKSVIANALNK